MANVKVTVTGSDEGSNSVVGQMMMAALRSSGFQVGLTDPKPNTTLGVGKVAYNTIAAVEVVNTPPPDMTMLQAKVVELGTENDLLKKQVLNLKADLAYMTDHPHNKPDTESTPVPVANLTDLNGEQ